MSKIKKPKARKTRDWGVIMMLQHTKPYKSVNRKKKNSKDSCRKWKKEYNNVRRSE